MTTTNEKPIPVEVPARYIKYKAVDFDGEIYAAMGGCLPIGGFLVRPPSLGVFSLLETYESPFIANAEACSVMEFWRVLYINENRQACVQEVMEWAYPKSEFTFDLKNHETWLEFDWNVYNFGMELGFDFSDSYMAENYVKVHSWFSLAFEGFAMIPGSGGSSEYWFGADSIGSLSSAIDESLERVLWELPMCAVGHQLAAKCKQNGSDHIDRPKDDEDRKNQFEAARERTRNGEFHPWQLEDPEHWPPAQEQVKYDPTIIDRWEALVKEKKNAN